MAKQETEERLDKKREKVKQRQSALFYFKIILD